MTVATPITPGQQKQYKRFVEDAADKALEGAGLDKDGLQKLIENGDEFQSRIIAAVRELSVGNQFVDEEVSSSYTYPRGYKVKGIVEQVMTLRELFPELREAMFDESVANRPLPAGAEGWFSIPRWENLSSAYGEAVEKVLELIMKDRKGNFYNWRKGKLGPQYLCQHERSVMMWEKIGDAQKDHNILVVPAQFGLRHCGHSVRRAREVFTPNEFGLGAFAVGIMLLTHPERLQYCDDLWIDCTGDEYSSAADGHFDGAPCFLVFGDDELEFSGHWLGFAGVSFGSASAFAE